MKKKTRKLTAGIVMTAVLGLPSLPALGADVASTDVKLTINGEPVSTNEDIGQPFITSNGYTMIPLRLVSEKFGYAIEWQPNGTIKISGEDGKVDVQLVIGADNYFANGKGGTFSEKPTLVNDRTYLPARDLMQLYGVVKWDEASRTVSISTGEQPAPEESDWVFTMGVGGTSETASTMYVQATNEKTGKVVYLTGADAALGDWVNDPAHEVDFFIGTSKRINGQDTVTIGRAGAMGMGEVALFLVPNLDKVEAGAAELTFVDWFNFTTDYTIANGYLYYTQGVNGPSVDDPNVLYFSKIGDEESKVTFNLDFSVNACMLTVEDGVLIATEKDGTRHEVLNVPEANSVDVAHMQKVLEENRTQEGFEGSDDFLTFDEIACMPGASVSEEGLDK